MIRTELTYADVCVSALITIDRCLRLAPYCTTPQTRKANIMCLGGLIDIYHGLTYTDFRVQCHAELTGVVLWERDS